jgi:hypothetical protein
MDETLRKVVERAKAYKASYLLKDKDTKIRERILLFMALDELEERHGASKRVEPGRGVEEGSGTGAAHDQPPSGPVA